VAPSVPIRDRPVRPTLVDAGQSSRTFLPYGTPCAEIFDPATQKLELLQCEVEQLRKRIAELAEEREQDQGGPSKGRSAGDRSRA
ncbi:MAG TPA: hypothetical protein VM422_08620, partial [Amaricoccus sp.]|nr:hypothetical protein [Amaricoccus sp.]